MEWKSEDLDPALPGDEPVPPETTLAYDPIIKSIVLFGGVNNMSSLNDTWTWSGITWTQQFPATSPSPRSYPALAFDPSLGQMILFGGSNGPPQVFNDTWAWNGSTWTELEFPAQPPARYAAGMVFDPLSNGLVLFGGLLGYPLANDTWLLVPVPLP
jgi:hypothetical protein